MRMVYKKIEELADVIAGQSPPSSVYNKTGKGIPFFQGKTDFTDKFPIIRNWCTVPTKIALPNDILISVRAPVGPVNICNVRSCVGRGLAAIRAKPYVSFEYLYYYLKKHESKIAKIGVGSTFSAITQKDINNFQITIPEEYNDQIRIATLLSSAEALIVQRKESLRLLDELVKGAFLEMFGDTANLGEKKIPLGKVASVVSGLTKGKKYKNQETIFVPYMRVANVQDNFLDLKEVKEIEATVEEVNRYQLKDGDLLLTEGGDPDKLGRGAIWRNEISNCIFQNHIFRVRVVDPNMLSPVFLCFLAGSSYGKRYFLRAAKQTTGIASINSTQLKDFPIVLPPLAVQTQFATLVEKVESLKKHYTDSLKELEQLYGSLSQRAFRGELDLSGMEVEAPVEEIPYSEEVPEPQEILSLGEQLAQLQKQMAKVYEPILASMKIIQPINSPIANAIAAVTATFRNREPIDRPVVAALQTVSKALEGANLDFGKMSKQISEGLFQYKGLQQDWAGLIRQMKNRKYTFEDLWEHELESQNYEEMKRMLFKWVKGDNPFMEQFFDEESKQIKFRLRETPSA